MLRRPRIPECRREKPLKTKAPKRGPTACRTVLLSLKNGVLSCIPRFRTPHSTMTRYLTRRLLLALPTLLIISVVGFFCGQMATDDPLQLTGAAPFTGNTHDPEAEARFMAGQAHTRQLDLPLFYWSIRNTDLPDTLHLIFPYTRRERLTRLAGACHHWPTVAAYEQALARCIRAAEAVPLPDTALVLRTGFDQAVNDLVKADVPEQVATATRAFAPVLDSLKKIPDPAAAQLQPAFDALQAQVTALQTVHRDTRPAFYWFGADNQYHHWLKGFLGAGTSNGVGAVWHSLRAPLYISLTVNVLALLIALVLAIPVSLYAARWLGRWPDKLVRSGMILLWALPMMVIGAALRYLLATPGHGFYLPWIGGIQTSALDLDRQSFGAWLLEITTSGVPNWHKFVLPTLTLCLHILALLVIQLRTGLVGVLNQDFIRTARAKGLSEWQVLRRHALRNALFPLVATIGGLLPVVVGGVVVVEAVFNFPGLGNATLEAFHSNNYPKMMAILLLIATVTVVGSLLADLVYTWLDPRVRLEGKK